jgi:hypothetical protein
MGCAAEPLFDRFEEMAEQIFGRIGEDGCFWTHVYRGVRWAMTRMRAIPRDDPFWRWPTEQPTEVRIRDVCARVLAEDPDDVEARWAAMWGAPYCPNELAEEDWVPLFELGIFEPRWLVEFACWVRLTCGVNTGQAVGLVLRQHRIADDVRPRLQSMRALELPWIDKWVDDVLAAIA